MTLVSAGRWAAPILLRGTVLSGGLPRILSISLRTITYTGNVVPQSLADLGGVMDISLLAVGSGGTWGTGLGLSQQKSCFI